MADPAHPADLCAAVGADHDQAKPTPPRHAADAGTASRAGGPTPGSLRIVTLGCRLNAFESEVIRQNASAAGLTNTAIVNTCAVTGEAVRQAAQTIRKLRREDPAVRIIVTGCAAQIEPGRFGAMTEVDAVIGNREKLQLRTFQALRAAGSERIQVNDIMSVRETAHAMIDGYGSKARAYVQVQNGCDHRCTFCVIPFGRGPSRSVAAGEVVAQCRRLTEAGYAEVVLTGVDITAYGSELSGEMSLGRLVRQILRQVPELRRLRLSSIDQIEADTHLLAAIAEEPRLMPHLHLSLQAGDDMILKRMKRRHLRADAIRFCAAVRQLRPEVAFGADLIAGFPTETPAMFANSLELVDSCALTYLHVFPFSPRPGTPAARMPQVAPPVVKERAARLRQRGAAALADHLARQPGRECDIVIERAGLGRTPDFAQLQLNTDAIPGTVLRARVTASDGRRLHGEAIAHTYAP
jgi:threonylcarbamoyladenosine tRNA methylthiotransferase MtaB